MIIREILPEEKDEYNKVVGHVMQSYEWGEFRSAMGIKVIRMGVFDDKKLVLGFTLTIHNIPKVNYTVGYLPKGNLPDELTIESLKKIGEENNCIFIKLEPNIEASDGVLKILSDLDLKLSPKPLFTKYTFQLDLTKNEEDLLRQMKEKTRYNVRLAERKGVKVTQEDSEQSFNEYLKLMRETTLRNKFFAHDEKYHRKMWETMKGSGDAKLLIARYQNVPLTAWVLFVFNNVLYYPYGASSSTYRELMASNLMMWEAIRLGKKMGCSLFDMWGCLGPNPNLKDDWYGFHRFKEGYSPRLVEFVGSYDLVLNQKLYPWYFRIDKLRWAMLRITRKWRI